MKELILISIMLASCNNQPNNSGIHETSNDFTKSPYKWDFNSNKNYVYDYQIKEQTQVNWEGEIDTTYSESDGRIEIISNKNGQADLLVFNNVLNNVLTLPHHKTSNSDLKPIAIQGLKSSGNIDELLIYSDLLQANFFILPKSDILKGEKEDIDIQIPIKIMGSQLLAKGIITISNLSEINDSIQVFKSNITVNELTVPNKLEFNATIDLTGVGKYIFNTHESRFESSEFNIKRNFTMYRTDVEVGLEKIVHQTKSDVNVTTKFNEIQN